MAELPGTKDSPIRSAQIDGVLASIRAKNEAATLPGVVKGAGGMAQPDEAELPGVDEDPRRSRLPGQSYFEDPNDFEMDGTLSTRQNEVKSVLGVVVPDNKLKTLAYASTVQGNRMIEFNNGLYMMDRGDEIELNVDTATADTDVTVEMTVDKAIKKGWGSIEFDGDPAVGDALWLECQRRGFAMKGHVPTAAALRVAATDPDIQQAFGNVEFDQSGQPIAEQPGMDQREMEDGGPDGSRFGDNMAAAGDHRLQGMENADRSGATVEKPANDGPLLDKFEDPGKDMRNRDEAKRMTI
ncbi:MAG: hypothetical protein Alpg2KO_26940 [Alphaproteobacteria bacterium]